MRSGTPAGRMQHSIPTWNRTRTWTFGGSDAIRYTIGMYNQSRRLDLHQHDPVYRTGALLFGHVGKQECRESNPVQQLWRLPARPRTHSCTAPGSLGAGAWRNDYSASWMLQ